MRDQEVVISMNSIWICYRYLKTSFVDTLIDFLPDSLCGTGHRKWTLWHPVVLECTSGRSAADATPEGTGRSRRPKWQASIKSTVGGSCSSLVDRCHAIQQNDWLCVFFLDCQGFSLWKWTRWTSLKGLCFQEVMK